MPVTASRSITVVTASGTAISTSSSWIPLNIHQTPFNVGFGVDKQGGGDVTFRIEHTFDNVFDPDITPAVFTHADVSAASADIDGNYAFAVRAVRLAVVSASGSSTTALKVVQAGI